eukprot:3125879-Ditylum_brightwellii.AAC.2
MEAQIMVTLSQAQPISSSSSPYLKSVKIDRSYVPTSWLSSTRTFLGKCYGKIIVQQSWLPKQQCKRDKILMGSFGSTIPGN